MDFSKFAAKVNAVSINIEGNDEILYVKELSAAEVFDVMKFHESHKNDMIKVERHVINKTICHEDGNSLTAEELKAIFECRNSVYSKVRDVALIASGLRKDEEVKEPTEGN